MGVPLYIICIFSLVAFNILSLSFIFVTLITMCLAVLLLGFILPRTLCFLDLFDYFLSHVRDVFHYYILKYFVRSFLSSPSITLTMQMLVLLMLSQRSLMLSSFKKIFLLYILF